MNDKVITVGICLNLKNIAASQYMNYNFNSLAVFNGKLIGANESGIFELSGNTNNGVEIESFFRLGYSDFNTPRQKTIRKFYITGYVDGNISLTTYLDGEVKTEYIRLYKGINTEIMSIDINSNDRGRYISILIKNLDGSDFSIDAIDTLMVPSTVFSYDNSLIGRVKSFIPIPENA